MKYKYKINKNKNEIFKIMFQDIGLSIEEWTRQYRTDIESQDERISFLNKSITQGDEDFEILERKVK